MPNTIRMAVLLILHMQPIAPADVNNYSTFTRTCDAEIGRTTFLVTYARWTLLLAKRKRKDGMLVKVTARIIKRGYCCYDTTGTDLVEPHFLED